MSDDAIVIAIVVVVPAAHVLALSWLLRGGRYRGVLALNATLAMAILLYQATRLRYTLMPPVDEQVLALIGFELLVLAAAIGAFRGLRPALILSYAAFALHVCASVAALVFVLTFRMTRLIQWGIESNFVA